MPTPCSPVTGAVWHQGRYLPPQVRLTSARPARARALSQAAPAPSRWAAAFVRPRRSLPGSLSRGFPDAAAIPLGRGLREAAAIVTPRVLRRPDRRGRRRLSRAAVRRWRVLELLLCAEQQVEHLRAQRLRAGQREPAAETDDQQRAAEPESTAGALALRVAERDRRVASRSQRTSELGMQLAVLEQRPGRNLAIRDAAVGALAGADGGADVLPQLGILHQPM